MGWPGSFEACLKGADFIQQNHRKSDACQIEIEISRQARRPSGAKQRGTGKPPLLGASARGFEYALEDPGSDVVLSNLAGPTQLDQGELDIEVELLGHGLSIPSLLHEG